MSKIILNLILCILIITVNGCGPSLTSLVYEDNKQDISKLLSEPKEIESDEARKAFCISIIESKYDISDIFIQNGITPCVRLDKYYGLEEKVLRYLSKYDKYKTSVVNIENDFKATIYKNSGAIYYSVDISIRGKKITRAGGVEITYLHFCNDNKYLCYLSKEQVIFPAGGPLKKTIVFEPYYEFNVIPIKWLYEK